MYAPFWPGLGEVDDSWISEVQRLVTSWQRTSILQIEYAILVRVIRAIVANAIT